MKIKYIVYALLVIGLASLVVYRISANKKEAGPAREEPVVAKAPVVQGAA